MSSKKRLKELEALLQALYEQEAELELEPDLFWAPGELRKLILLRRSALLAEYRNLLGRIDVQESER